jgi:protein TonB
VVQDVKPEAQPKAETKTKPAKPVKEAQKKPAAEKKTAKQKTEAGKKVAEKADARPKKSGNKGRNEAKTVRGQADGQEKGDSRQASRGGSKNGEVGNAAVSNYPGKVRSKLARVARSVRAKGRGEVVVAFAVGSNGGVRSARVARSSGVSSVDQAALQAIRKASPFPPIPANAGRSTWEFSIPLAFMR